MLCRMPGRVATFAAILSLLLCAATVTLWVRARRVAVVPDRLTLWVGESPFGLRCDRNKIALIGPPPSGRPGDLAEARGMALRLHNPKDPPPTDSDARGLSADVREEGWSFLPAPVPTAPLLKAMQDPRRFVAAQIQLRRVTVGGGFVAPSVVSRPAGDGGSQADAPFTPADVRSVVGQWHDLLGAPLGSAPFALVVALTLIAPARFGRRMWRHRQRKRLHLCLGCGYDLQASPLRCPECGRAVSGASNGGDADQKTLLGTTADPIGEEREAPASNLRTRSRAAIACLALLLVGGIGTFVLMSAVRAPTGDGGESFAEQTRRDEEQMERMFTAIRRAAESGAWLTPGWRDRKLEADLEQIVAQTRETAGVASRALPAEFSNVRPVADVTDGPFGMDGVLYVAKDNHVEIGSASRSIILIDGDLKLARASNCIVVVSGAAEISFGAGNVVVAGHYLHVAHEGSPGLREPGTPDSMLFTGSVIDIAHAHGTVCSAPRLARIGFHNGGKLVDVPVTDPAHGTAGTRKRRARFTVAPEPKQNPLKGVLRIISTSRPLDNRPSRTARAVLSDGSKLTLRMGSPILNGDGSTLPALAGWRTSVIDDGYVLLSKNEDRAEFFAPTEAIE